MEKRLTKGRTRSLERTRAGHALADIGFRPADQPARFATNVAAWFTGGRPGRLLAYSTHPGAPPRRQKSKFLSVLVEHRFGVDGGR